MPLLLSLTGMMPRMLIDHQCPTSSRVASSFLYNDHESINIITTGELMRKCRFLVPMIKQSTLNRSFFDLSSVLLETRRMLSIDDCTRCNSTLFMIDSFIALKSMIFKVFNMKPHFRLQHKQSEKLDRFELTSSDWTSLKILRQLLKPFDLAMKLQSSQQFLTISLCILVLHNIEAFLEDTKSDGDLVRRLKNCLLKSMTRYIDDENEPMQMIRVSHFE
jgi:hypothetical protein